MTQQHPITPPPELIYEWAEDRELLRDPLPLPEYIANCAAQWGADQELEACCEWLQDPDLNVDTYKLRAARRLGAASLKEQALQALAEADVGLTELEWPQCSDTIRRALEQLPDNN
jgi:hypothetical protein